MIAFAQRLVTLTDWIFSDVFARFPGEWQVRQQFENTGAIALRERFHTSPSAVSSPSRRMGLRINWRIVPIR